MSFDYFSKRRMQYILEKLKTIFDTKTETWTGTQAELAQQLSSIKNGTIINITDDDESLTTNLSALTDTDISSPIDGQGLVYDNASEKWENKNLFSGNYNDLTNKPTIPSVIDNLTSTSTSDALSAKQGKVLKDALDSKVVKLTITVSESEDPQTGDEVLVADKTPSEVLAALNGSMVVEVVYEGGVYLILNNSLSIGGTILFGATAGDNNVGMFHQEIYFTKDSQNDTWESIELISTEVLESLRASISYSNNTYSCNYTYSEVEDARSNGLNIFMYYNSEAYNFVKYDSSENTFYFSTTLADSDGVTTKTFVMVGDDTTGDWDSITLTESSGGSASSFLVRVYEDPQTQQTTCDKLPSEILAAYTNGSIIQAKIELEGEDSMLDLATCLLSSSPYLVVFSTLVTRQNDDTVTLSLHLQKDSSSDTWEDIDIYQSNLCHYVGNISHDTNGYYFNITPSMFDDAISYSLGARIKYVDSDNDVTYDFYLSRYDTSDSEHTVFYLTSVNADSTGETTILTFAMYPDWELDEWDNIVLYETNGSGDVIWTGTQAELALVVNTLPEGAIINITDDQEVIGGSLAALSDTNISSPTNGQGLIYNSATQKWQNQNLPSGTDIFTITLTESVDPQTGEVTFTSDKLPSEVVAAKNSGSIIQLTATDTANFYFDLSIDYITEEETVFIFTNVRTSSNHQVLFIGFNLIKDANSDTWASIEFLNPEFNETIFIEMEESSGEYSCNVDFNTLDDAYYHSMDMIVEFESEFFRLVKYDTSEDTFYFANTVSDSSEITTKTFVMVGDSSENEWTSITLTESSGGGTGDTPIWTGTTAEYEAQASQIANGTIVNLTDDQENIPTGGLLPHIIISTETGSTILITKGTSSITPLETSTGIYETDIPNYGTWVISATKNSDTQTKQLVVNTVMIYEITIEHGVDGSTVLPTDDIQTWLACANITDKSYTTLAEVLADRETFETLIADSNACDYMARSTSWAGSSEGLVPTMTSDTQPSGECFSSYDNSNAYLVFDGNDTSAFAGSTSTATQSFGYDFGEPVYVNKATHLSQSAYGTTNPKIKIQYSDDKSTWQDASEPVSFGASANIQTTIIGNINTPHRYWRVYLYGDGGSSSWNTYTVQFYLTGIVTDSDAMALIGHYDYCSNALLGNSVWAEAIANSDYFEEVLNVKVPVMTGYTTPEGTVSSNSEYNSTYLGWKAFDGDNSTYWGCAETGSLDCWVKYQYTKNVSVSKVHVQLLQALSDVKTRIDSIYVKDANDTELYSIQTSDLTSNEFDILIDVTNNSNAVKFGYIKKSAYGISANLQFYGRASSNVSNTNGIIHTAMGNDSVYCVETGDTFTATDGIATVDFSQFDEGVYTFGSTTAKNPDNLSQDYTKQFRITKSPYGGTTELYLMPDAVKTLYWWGYESDELEDMSTANGWTASGITYVVPTRNTNDIYLNVSSVNQLTGVGTKTAISPTTIKAVGQGVSALNNIYGQICQVATKTNSASNVVNIDSSSLKKYDFQGSSNNYAFIAGWRAPNGLVLSKINAFWYE